MGFPENKKLAKDINKNTELCAEQLETLLASINAQMGLMNSLISSISGGYVSKDYVDSGDNVVREEYKAADNILQTKIDAILAAYNEKKYIASDAQIATLTYTATNAEYGNGKKSVNTFTALYNGTVKYKFSAYETGGQGFLKVSIWRQDTNQVIATYSPATTTESQEFSVTFPVVAGGVYYSQFSNTSGNSGAHCYWGKTHQICADIGNGL